MRGGREKRRQVRCDGGCRRLAFEGRVEEERKVGEGSNDGPRTPEKKGW